MKKTLVAYFSVSGTTKEVATRLAAAAGADLFEIQPEVPYTQDDLDWTNPQSRVAREIDNRYSRPKIAGTVGNLSDYEQVYLGFPIWWYTNPTIINTFIEAHDWGNILIIPFATSDGSKIGKIHRACAEMRRDYPKINWNEGRLLNNPSDKSLNDWAHQHE